MTIEEKVVTTFPELLEATRIARSQFGEGTVILFRGQESADPAWCLRPRVFRGGFSAWAENMMIEEFQREAVARYPKCPDREDSASWLSLMQHYGLPTRLLDWTRSAAIAAYFAVSHKAHQGNAVIWALSPKNLNPADADGVTQELALAHLGGKLAAQQLPYKLRDRDPKQSSDVENRIVACAVDEIDPRLMLQQGAFTVHGPETPLEELQNSDQFLVKFVIPDGQPKAEINDALDLLGIKRSYLFPDLGNLARCIEGRWHGH
jgi:hypothetical protein